VQEQTSTDRDPRPARNGKSAQATEELTSVLSDDGGLGCGFLSVHAASASTIP
jgi:hypothetical protein